MICEALLKVEINVLDRYKGLTSDRTHGQRTNAYKKQGAPD
jgi:hypothetical protein